MVQSLIQYRGFIWRQAVADLQNRYAGTSLGALWNIVHPFAAIVIYCVVFSAVMSSRLGNLSGRTSYAIYLCSGFFPWLAFSECVSLGTNALVSNAGYLRKLPVPEQVFVAQNAISSTLTLGISFTLLLLIAWATGFHPAWQWLLLPVPLILLQAQAFAIAMLLGTLNVFFRDVAQWVAVALQLIMWTAPIVYVADILPAAMRAILPFHPLYPALEAIRDLVLYARISPPHVWLAMSLWPLGFAVIAHLVLRKLRPEIRDVL
jgi:lipopolysaccharide transport system permease protein